MDFLFGLVIGLMIGWATTKPQFVIELQTKLLDLIANKTR